MREAESLKLGPEKNPILVRNRPPDEIAGQLRAGLSEPVVARIRQEDGEARENAGRAVVELRGASARRQAQIREPCDRGFPRRVIPPRVGDQGPSEDQPGLAKQE